MIRKGIGIDPDLYEDVKKCSEETFVPIIRLTEECLRAYLKGDTNVKTLPRRAKKNAAKPTR